MYTLFRKLSPNFSLASEDTGNDTNHAEAQADSLSRNDSDADALSERLTRLQLKPQDHRYFGKSSTVMLVQTALDIKRSGHDKGFSRSCLSISKRPEFWSFSAMVSARYRI
jgi:hypothetical protein